ncbi:auxilin/cyclin g-associated kinase-related [Anaeramoeba flamelloides]|uniref:Auxilin/cyclin g-associated kinase-related n=1 Tax=Anaeramoeba flamelloides TaxID=1746091 RepID=A0AAV7ZNH6_9EUKA|nr:auxilin/cyclin g-associated kinase-related [Anaeramoeba flamelloides]
MFLLSNGEHNTTPKQPPLDSKKFFTRLESKTKFNKENPTPFVKTFFSKLFSDPNIKKKQIFSKDCLCLLNLVNILVPTKLNKIKIIGSVEEQSKSNFQEYMHTLSFLKYPKNKGVPIEEYLSGESEAINFISNTVYWLVRNYKKHGIIRSTTQNSRTFYLFKGDLKIKNFQTTKCKNVYWTNPNSNTDSNSNSNTERGSSGSETISSDEEMDGNWKATSFKGKKKKKKKKETNTSTNTNTNTNSISSENSEKESNTTSEQDVSSNKRNDSDLSSSDSSEKVLKKKNKKNTSNNSNSESGRNSGSETNSDFDEDPFQNNELEDNLYEIKYGLDEKIYFNQDLDTIIKQMDPKPTLGRQRCVYLNYLLFNTIDEWKSASHEKTLNQKCSENLEKYDNYTQEAYEDVLLVAKMGGASFKCQIYEDLNFIKKNKILKENEEKSSSRKGNQQINHAEENKKVLELEKKNLQIVDPIKFDAENFKKLNAKTYYKSKLSTKMGFAFSPNNRKIFAIKRDAKKESKYLILEFETIIEMLSTLISIIFFISKKNEKKLIGYNPEIETEPVVKNTRIMPTLKSPNKKFYKQMSSTELIDMNTGPRKILENYYRNNGVNFLVTVVTKNEFPLKPGFIIIKKNNLQIGVEKNIIHNVGYECSIMIEKSKNNSKVFKINWTIQRSCRAIAQGTAKIVCANSAERSLVSRSILYFSEKWIKANKKKRNKKKN